MAHGITSVHLPAEHALSVTSKEFSSVEIRQVVNGTALVEIIIPNRVLRVGPFSIPRNYLLISETTDFEYSIENERLAYNHEGTGIFEGGTMSINTDTTKFDVAAGTGVIVDNYTNPQVPNVIHITWPDLTDITTEFLTSEFGSFIAIDKTGTVLQVPASDPEVDKRDNIFLGILGHSNLTTITSIASAPAPGYDQVHAFIDMADTIGIINKSGNIYDANGANLLVDKSVGQSFSIGYNHPNSVKAPNITTDPATTTTNLVRVLRDGAGGFTVPGIFTAVDVANYDNDSGAPFAVPASDPWQIFRIYHSPGIENHVIAYGQQIYKNAAIAEASIFGEVFDEPPELANTILRAYLIVKRDATDLSDISKAKFIQANKFGTAPGSGVTSSTTTLQQAYVNSDSEEITLSSTNGGLDIRDAATPIGTGLMRICDNAASVEFFTVDTSGINAPNLGKTLLLSETASSSPTIDLESFIDDTKFTNYEIELTNIIPATDGAILQMRIGTGATPTYQSGVSDYSWLGNYVTSVPANTPVADTADSVISLSLGLGLNSVGDAGSLCGDLRVFAPSGTAKHTRIEFTEILESDADGEVLITGSAKYSNTTAVTALQFFMDSGNIASGIFKLYGIR